MRATEFIVEGLAEGSLNEYRDQLWTWVQSKFPRTQWPEYVQRDFLYAKAKGNKNQKDLEDFLDEIQRDFGRVRWQLEKLPITLDIFTPKTQRMIQSREGGSSNPYQVPKDAERHSLQQKMIQQKGVSEEPIIVAKLSNGYDLIEGWHRTIQHLKEFPQGYTAPAWVGYGTTYTSESVEQAVAEGTTVTRIDSKPITDFGSSLKAYKHTDDWSQSGVDTGDDSYWKNKNLKTNTTKGLFAGDPKRTALYATGNAHETRYVEFTQNGQPIVYFDRKDLPAMRSRKTYLTVFDASDFRQLPTGEWFSENPSKPIKQVPIGDPFKYIADQGWIVRVTDDLDKVFKQVKNMHKAGKIAQYGAEGMNESKQGVDEGLDEAVGGNYLYHATGADGLRGMLSSGSIRSAAGPQAATSAQTKLPTVSVTRDWGYASGAQAQSQLGGIGRDAILVLDRNAVESNFKTLGTSQSTIVKGLSFNPYLKKDGEARSQNTDPMARANAKAKMKYAEPTAKAGGEFEEAVVVPKGALPLKGTMVGFWINPKSELMKDPTIMNDPRRLDMVRPNQFVKAKQEQGVAEDN